MPANASEPADAPQAHMTASAVSLLTASAVSPLTANASEPADAPQAHMTANAVSPLTASTASPLTRRRRI